MSLSSPSGQDIMVNYNTADGSAQSSSDYVAVFGGSVTIPAGQTSAQISIQVNGDTLYEATEDFTVTITTDPSKATILDGTGVGAIQNDDAPPNVFLNNPFSAPTEGNAGQQAFMFAVQLLDPVSSMPTTSGLPVIITYSTADGTASSTSDYTGVTDGNLTIPPGGMSGIITIQVNGDTMHEADEDFFVNLTNVTNGTILNGQGRGVIQNDDKVQVSINSTSLVPEGNVGQTNMVFTVTFAEASSQGVTVNFSTSDGTAMAGSDYTANSGSRSFAPGETVQTITILVNGDLTHEPAETLFVTLSGDPSVMTFSSSVGTGTIANDDGLPQISIADVAINEGNSGATNALFTVSLSNPSSQDITVFYNTANGLAQSGSDYVAVANGSATIPAGQTSAQISIQVNGDTLHEATEDFTVSIATDPAKANIADGVGFGAILNDDAPPNVSIDDAPAVAEGNSGTTTAMFTVRLLDPVSGTPTTSGQTVVVNYSTSDGTAQAGSDYTAIVNGQAVIPTGAMTAQIIVQVNGDAIFEADEAFFVNLTGATNATLLDAQGQGLIQNDDAAGPPTATSVSPAVMNPNQNVPAAITGTNFVTGNTSINFTQGTGITATNVQVISSTQLTATFVLASNASLGLHKFTVTTPGGTSAAVSFDVLNRTTVSSISPNNGNQGAVVVVTLTGTNVYNNSTCVVSPSTDVTVSSPQKLSTTQLRCTLTIGANAAPGPRDVSISNLAGVSNSVVFTINPPPQPVLNSVMPNSGTPGANVPVTLNGMNFLSGASVNISGSGVSAINVQVVNSTQITATFVIAANATTGPYDVSVTTSAGTSNTVVFSVSSSDPPPSVTVLTPNGGESLFAGAPYLIQWSASDNAPLSFFDVFYSIDGGGTFNPVPGCSAVSGAASSCSWASPGPVTTMALVRVVATDSAANTAADNSDAVFSIVSGAPTVTAHSPTVMNPNQNVLVTITGTNFVTGNTSITFTFGTGVTVTNVQVLSSTQLTATFVLAANASLGGHRFRVTTPGGSSAERNFDVLNRTTLSSISPDNGDPGTAVVATLTGTSIYNNSTCLVNTGSITVSNVVRLSSTQLRCTLTISAGATPGPYNVTVSNLAGVSNALLFTVNGAVGPPTLNSVTPNNGMQGQSVPVTLDGTNFIVGASVNVSTPDITVTNVVRVSNAQITATFVIAANAVPGPYDVSVTTSAGASNTVSFTVNVMSQTPVLNNVMPASGTIGSSVNLTLNGANFFGTPTVNVSGNGITVMNTSVVNSNQITATFVIDGTAAAGARSVSVTTVDGTSNSVTFTVNLPPAPTTTAISPAVMNPNQNVLVTITGTNFVTGNTSITFTFGTGVTVNNVQVLSSTQLTATFVLAANASLGGHRFRVTTPGGTSAERNFDVLNRTTLSSISPNTGAPGTAVVATLTGTSIYNGSTCLVSGNQVTVSNVVRLSNTQLRCTLTIPAGATLGPVDVTVSNLAGVSNAVVFTIQ